MVLDVNIANIIDKIISMINQKASKRIKTLLQV